MGRARNRMAGTALANFDAVFGTRRGTEQGNLFAPNPSENDRLEMQRLAATLDRGSNTEIVALLTEHQHQIDRLPLLGELQERLCKQLASQSSQRHRGHADRLLTALSFDPDMERGRLFDVPKLQELFDSGLRAQLQKRTRALIKVKQPIGDPVVDAAWMEEFKKIAAAQCFQNRVAVCERLLNAPPTPALNNVQSWRNAINSLMDQRSSLEKDEIERALRGASPKPERARPAAPPRRRQRYI